MKGVIDNVELEVHLMGMEGPEYGEGFCGCGQRNTKRLLQMLRR